MLKVLLSAILMMFSVFSANAETLVADPTLPSAGFVSVTKEVEVASQFVVSSLITGKQKNMAVVNGQRVVVGDQVDGAAIVAISKQGVQLRLGGENKFISLAERKGFSKVKSMK